MLEMGNVSSKPTNVIPFRPKAARSEQLRQTAAQPQVRFQGETWEKLKLAYNAQSSGTKAVLNGIGAGACLVGTFVLPIPFISVVTIPAAIALGANAVKKAKED